MVATVDWPKPRKMSAMPQIPKLTISTPVTTAMMVLPSQFDEALRNPRSMGPICRQEGRTRLKADSAKGRHRIEKAYKEAVARSQPQRHASNERPIEAVNGGSLALVLVGRVC